MRVMTCNIRYSAAPDGDNAWPHRKQLCIDVIGSRAPDIICCQEVMADQLAELRAALAAHDWCGMTRDAEGRDVPNPIFYRREAFALISTGGYWLSETPHVPGSSSWASYDVRLANWVRLIHRPSGTALRVVNTHLDCDSQQARENQARLIAEDTRAYPNDSPQILAGDMNCDARNEAIAILREAGWRDTYEAVHGTADPGFTFHKFQGPQCDSEVGKMDWIFVRGTLRGPAAVRGRGAVRVLDAEIVTDSRDGRFPSDHYFVTADVEI